VCGVYSLQGIACVSWLHYLFRLRTARHTCAAAPTMVSGPIHRWAALQSLRAPAPAPLRRRHLSRRALRPLTQFARAQPQPFPTAADRALQSRFGAGNWR
jgi:hypothetical protein